MNSLMYVLDVVGPAESVAIPVALFIILPLALAGIVAATVFTVLAIRKKRDAEAPKTEEKETDVKEPEEKQENGE